MITTVMTAIGGLVKDIQTTAVATATTIYDELSSIPESFSKGYEKGLLTSEEEVKEESAIKENVLTERIEELANCLDRPIGEKEMIEERKMLHQATKLNRNRKGR